jgi:hypothetical protein
MKLNNIISLEPLDSYLCDINIFPNRNVTKIVASIVVCNNRGVFSSFLNRNEVREFYIVHDDTEVYNIYDATLNLQNFADWDPENTLLYKQLANACMIDVLEENFNL